MSRTYRRTNAKWAARNDDYEFVTMVSKYGGHYYNYVKMDENSKECKKVWSRYHSDKNRQYYNSPPSWFCNIYFQRPARRSAKIALEQWKKGSKEQEEDILLPKFKKCAGYDWW